MRFVVAVLMVLMLLVVPVMAQDDLATYEGDGFSFAYPAGWFEVAPMTEDYQIAVSPDETAQMLEGGGTSALMVSVMYMDDLAAVMGQTGEGMFEVEGEVSPEILTGYVGGIYFMLDSFMAGFAGVEASTSVSIVEKDGSVLLYFDGYSSDNIFSVIEVDTGVYVLLIAQAPAGTLEDWREDVSAIVGSFEAG